MENSVHLYTASLRDRVNTMMKSLESLHKQVDTIQLAVNYFVGLNEVISNFNGTPLSVIFHDNSLRDGSRFINANKKPGYCLVCDDDIEYPPDFVERMIATYNSTPMGFLTVMGKNLKPRPLQSYYKGWAENYKTFSEVKELTRVDIPGCCGILWHTNRVTISDYNMHVPNSDVCVGVHAYNLGLPCYVIPHAATWLKNLMPELPKGTLDIYNTYKNNDKLQTEFINRWM